jgi:hypothetical protein
MIDTKAKSLKGLQDTQHSFLRRVLCLGDHSIIAVLFSETGVWPIKYRRLDLALRYAGYLIQLPHQRLAWKAWAESVLLHHDFERKHLTFQSGWTHDLSIALPAASFPRSYDDWTGETIVAMRALVKQEMLSYIQDKIPMSRTPSIAIRVRTRSTLKRHAYLDVPSQNHRICLTRILCASHDLAVEALRRRKLDGNKIIERIDRLCRLCGTVTGAVEEVHHALFTCKGHLRLLTLRNEFYKNLPKMNESSLPDDFDNDAWNAIIGAWADDITSAIPLARLAWHVSRLFYDHPIRVPDLPSLSIATIETVSLDPASDYSSEEEIDVTAGSGGR